jgi:hypothetical protein
MKRNADLLSKFAVGSLYKDEGLIGKRGNLDRDREEDREEESGGMMHGLKNGMTPSPRCTYVCVKF